MSAVPKRKAAAQAQLATKSQLAPRAAAAAAKAAKSAPRPRHGSWDTSSLSSLSDLSDPSDLEPDSAAPTGAPQLAPPPSAPAAPAPAPPAAQRKRKASGQDAGTKRSPKRAKKQQPQPAPESSKPPRAEEAPMPVRPGGDVWTLTLVIMDRYAFVRLDQDGNPTDGSKESSAAPGYWWPSKVLSDSCRPPIDVQLFGDDGHGAARLVELHAPSEFNIVTTRRNNSAPQRRFQQANFASPPNRFGNLCSKWSQAMDEYSSYIMSDGGLGQHVSPLPMPVPGGSSQPPTPTRKRAQPKPRKARAARIADTTIRLPGEKVLARRKESTTTSLHWPALVQQFQSKGGKYQLLFFDDSEQWVVRENFFLRHEDGFSQCNVDMELWGLEERDREFDDDDEDIPFVIPTRDKGMPSPPPELPSLPLCGDGSDYCALPIRAQVALVEGVLDLIINDKYLPARRRHRDFIKGRRAREMLAQTAGAKGSLTVDEQTQIREIVRKWALRDERWAKHIDDFGDVDGDDADDEAPPTAARLPSPSPAAAVEVRPTTSSPRPSSLPPPGEPEVAVQDESMDVDPDTIAAIEDVDLDMHAMDDVLNFGDVFAAPAPPVVQTFTGVMRSPTESAMHSPDLHYMPSLAPTQPGSYGALGLAFGSDSASQPVPGPSSTPDDSGATMAVDTEEAATAMAVDVEAASEEPALATQDTSAPAMDEAAAPVDGEDVAMLDSTAPVEATLASQPTAADTQAVAEEGSSEPSPAIAVPADEPAIAPPPVDAADAVLSVASPSAPVDDTSTVPPTASPFTAAVNTALPPSSQPASLLGASSPPPTQPVTDSSSSQAENSSPAPQAAELDASSPADRGSETAASDSASGAETHVGQPMPSDRVPHRSGCATYEALSESERNQYCIDVLTYEAVIQVLLWRSGKRTAIEPLEDDGAENALHEEGINLANTYDHKLWVYEIADRRRKKDQKKPPLLKRETHSGKELRSAHKINYREDD